MLIFRKIRNLFNPYKIDTCSSCDHGEYFHRGDLAQSNYPGITCYGYNGFKPSYEKRCRCKGFIQKTNLDYLEYKAAEKGVI